MSNYTASPSRLLLLLLLALVISWRQQREREEEEEEEEEEKKRGWRGGRWEVAAWAVLGVAVRKSACRFLEVGQMLLDLASVFASVVRFSGFALRRPVAVARRHYSPSSSMVARHDR